MSHLFEKAISKVRQLPESQQDSIAQLVLEEIDSERQWDSILSQSPQKLASLADKAWKEHEAGSSRPLDPDTL